MMMNGSGDAAASAAIMDLVSAVGPVKSICPTEVARAMVTRSGGGQSAESEAWRRHLPEVRRAAVHLAQTGRIDILHKGKVIAPDAVHGVIRLRLRSNQELR
ncbi:MAG: DUF3253 domain-containing protein [Acidiphilium sp.]